MFKLKEITESSWWVEGDNTVGLLSEHNNQLTLIDQEQTRTTFNGRDEAKDWFGADIFDNLVTVQDYTKENFVKGYPVDFHNPLEIQVDGVDLPLYSKTEAGNVPYCAGYYVVHFEKASLPSHCPKLKTLQTYGYEGPFKTKMEMKAVLKKIKAEQTS